MHVQYHKSIYKCYYLIALNLKVDEQSAFVIWDVLLCCIMMYYGLFHFVPMGALFLSLGDEWKHWLYAAVLTFGVQHSSFYIITVYRLFLEIWVLGFNRVSWFRVCLFGWTRERMKALSNETDVHEPHLHQLSIRQIEQIPHHIHTWKIASNVICWHANIHTQRPFLLLLSEASKCSQAGIWRHDMGTRLSWGLCWGLRRMLRCPCKMLTHYVHMYRNIGSSARCCRKKISLEPFWQMTTENMGIYCIHFDWTQPPRPWLSRPPAQYLHKASSVCASECAHSCFTSKLAFDQPEAVLLTITDVREECQGELEYVEMTWNDWTPKNSKTFHPQFLSGWACRDGHSHRPPGGRASQRWQGQVTFGGSWPTETFANAGFLWWFGSLRVRGPRLKIATEVDLVATRRQLLQISGSYIWGQAVGH